MYVANTYLSKLPFTHYLVNSAAWRGGEKHKKKHLTPACSGHAQNSHHIQKVYSSDYSEVAVQPVSELSAREPLRHPCFQVGSSQVGEGGMAYYWVLHNSSDLS